ncbi:MAG: flippase [Bacteroidota bacterium]|nr:flippase [Bacteroidota bacterium]
MNKEIAKSIAKNTTVLMGSQSVTWTMSFLLLLFLPRYLGSVDYGRLYLANSIFAIFMLLIDFGGRYSITKEVARSRESVGSIAVNAIGIRIIFWAFSFLGLVIFTFLSGYPPVLQILLVLYGISMLWESTRKVLWSCYQGFEQMRYPSIAAIVEQIFITIFAITALLLGAGLLIIGTIMVIGSLLNFGIHVKFAKQIISTLPRFQFKESLKLIRKGIPFFLWSIFGLIYYRVDAVMLSFMTPESIVGWYGAAYRFFDILMFIPSIFSVAVFPILSRIWKDKEGLSLTTSKSLDFIIVAGIPVSISLFFFAHEIINLFYGLAGFGPTVLILKIFSVGILLVYIDMILGTAILASDKLRQWSLVALAAVFINIGLNYFMIPYTQVNYGNGGIGAAIATIITEFFVMLFALYLIPKTTLAIARPSVSIKAITSGLFMVGALYALSFSPQPWVIEAIVGILIYGVILLIIKTLEPEELDFFKEYITFKNLKNIIIPSKGKEE